MKSCRFGESAKLGQLPLADSPLQGVSRSRSGTWIHRLSPESNSGQGERHQAPHCGLGRWVERGMLGGPGVRSGRTAPLQNTRISRPPGLWAQLSQPTPALVRGLGLCSSPGMLWGSWCGAGLAAAPSDSASEVQGAEGARACLVRHHGKTSGSSTLGPVA